jgi:hypothetical protein
MTWPALAQEPESRWKFSGFGTLGVAWNSTGQAGFRRDTEQPSGATRQLDGRTDTRLGLQLDTQLSRSLQGTLQVLSKYQYDGTFTPQVSWAFLGWSPEPEVKIRLGRLGVESFMNADSRDVGYTYLLVRPPMEVYGVIPVTRLDGMDATGTLGLGAQVGLRVKAFYGATSEKVPLTLMNSPVVLDMTGDRVGGLVTEIETGRWRGRLSFARLEIRRDFPQAIRTLQTELATFAEKPGRAQLLPTADALVFSGGTLDSYTAGLSYEDGPFQAQAMVADLHSNRIPLPKGVSGYLSLGYRLGKLVPYGLWSRLASQRPPGLYLKGLPPPVAQEIQQFTSGFSCSQSTTGAGVRWDFRDKADFKLQVDRITSDVPSRLWSQVQPGWDGRATVVSLVLDFVL